LPIRLPPRSGRPGLPAVARAEWRAPARSFRQCGEAGCAVGGKQLGRHCFGSERIAEGKQIDVVFDLPTSCSATSSFMSPSNSGSVSSVTFRSSSKSNWRPATAAVASTWRVARLRRSVRR
jgi:hypothetical protein